MTIRTVNVPGLPPEIEIRRSTRRRRSVAAHREADTTVVVVPERMSAREITKHALALHQRLLTRASRRRPSDEQLFVRAKQLQRKYLSEGPLPESVSWSTQQRQRWGSCTPLDGAIRLSSRMQDMPQYVIDYVLVHELAHLSHSNHGPEFNALVARFPDAERACAYLDGVEFGHTQNW